jgi:hypothetical protein
MYPKKAWNFKAQAPADCNVNVPAARLAFTEVLRNAEALADGATITAKLLEDAIAADLVERCRADRCHGGSKDWKGYPTAPSLVNYFSCKAGAKHHWKLAVLAFLARPAAAASGGGK